MTASSPTLRLFVSSTFDNFTAERDALQRGVYSVIGELLVESPFRRLRQRCVSHGSDLEIVDLRWGISAAVSTSYATMHRCLAEVRRAIAAPHPNFLALVGDRYGWQPVPAALPSARFDDMISMASPEDAGLLREWYRLETNHIPASYVLRSERGGLSTALERRLRRAVRNAWIASGGTLDRCFGSATEQEIRLALTDRAVGDRSAALCFHRRIVDLDSGVEASRFQDLLPDGSPDGDSRLAVAALVDDLRQDGRVAFREYEVAWLPGGPAADVTYLAQFAEDVHAELDRRVGETLEELDRRGSSEEHEAHAAFAADHRRIFIGRRVERETVDAYLGRPATGPLVVSGPGGSGKSALLAWTAAAAERLGHRVQQRFIGISAESSVGDQLAAALVTEATGAGSAPLGDPIDALGTTLSEPPSVSTTVVIDGMDLLPDGDELARFRWLPEPWPSRLRVLIATRSDDDVTRLRRIQSNTITVRLGSLAETEATTLFNTLLDAACRAVSPPQRALVAAALAHGVRTPLYVRMLASLALSWSVADDVDAPPRDLDGVIRQLFDELSAADRHGVVLVAAVCCFLAASRLGLTSAELLDALSTDEQVMADFRRRHPHSPPVDVLPTIVWSALRADLDPYLGARSSDGLALIDFFHLDLRLVAARYLDGPQGVQTHRRLAELFTRRGTSEGHWLPRAKRSATETGHHRLAAGDNHVFDTLVRDGSFVLAAAGQWDFKAGQTAPRVNPAAELIVQLRRRGEGDPAAARAAETLAAGREVLAVYPQGAAQLLSNDGFPITGIPEFAGLWARRVGDAPRPSQGHASPVTALAISEDGTHLASGDLEGRVGWWTIGLDPQWCHAGHKGWVTAVAISPDGRTLASSGDDGAVLLWDTATAHAEPVHLHTGLWRPQAGPLGFADATCLLFFWLGRVHAIDLESGSVRQLRHTAALDGKGLLKWEEPEQVVFAGSRLVVYYDSEAGRTGDVAVADVLDDSLELHQTTPYGTGVVALDRRRVLLSSVDGFRLFDLARPKDPPRHAAGPTCGSLSIHRTLGFVGLEQAHRARILGIGDDLDPVVIARLPTRQEGNGTPHLVRSSPGTDLIAVSWTSGRISVVDPVVGREVAVSAGSPRIVRGAIDRRGQIGGGAMAGATPYEARQFALVSTATAPVITTSLHTDQIVNVASTTSGELVSVDRVGGVVVHHNGGVPDRLAIGVEISSACEWRDVDGVAVGTTDGRVLLIGPEPAEIDIGRSRPHGRVTIANLDAQGNPPTVAVALLNGLTAWSHGDDVHWRPHDPPDTFIDLTAVRLLANGSVADGSSSGRVRVWDPSTTEPILSWDAHVGAVQSVQEIGEHLLMSAGSSGSIFIVDLRNTMVVCGVLIFGGLVAVRIIGHELVVLRRDGWLARYALEGMRG